MVLVKNWQFSISFLRQNKPGKCVSRYSRKKKHLSRLWKQELNKVKKTGIFPTRLVYGFGKKLSIFPCFYFRQNRLGKCVSRYSRKKKRLSRLQKREVQKSSYNSMLSPSTHQYYFPFISVIFTVTVTKIYLCVFCHQFCTLSTNFHWRKKFDNFRLFLSNLPSCVIFLPRLFSVFIFLLKSNLN